MNIATAFLIFFTCILMPLPIKIEIGCLLSDKAAKITAKLYVVRLLNQHIKLDGAKLELTGTINGEVSLADANFKNGIDFTKCFSVYAIDVSTFCNLCEAETLKALTALNFLMRIAVPILCAATHLRIGVQNFPTTEKSSVKSKLLLTTSVLECAYALIKQGVQKWNFK